MSVPTYDRKQSRFEVYNTAKELRLFLAKWLLRDFGIKNKIRKAETLAQSRRMTKEDKETFLSLLQNYGLADEITMYYPDWWVVERRRTIDRICSELMKCIRCANSIYVTTQEEYAERRNWQNKAIGMLETLVEELQFVVTILHDTLGIDVEKYMPVMDMVEKEISLVKAWRKSDNKLRARIKA